jgi:hypothetical protein
MGNLELLLIYTAVVSIGCLFASLWFNDRENAA